MEVRFRALNEDLEIAQATQAVGHGRDSGGPLAGVRDDGVVAGQFRGMIGKEFFEIRPAHFLFAFNHIDHIHRQPAGSFHPRLGGLEVGKKLAFVVGGSTGVNIAVFNHRLERFCVPTITFFGRLNVVMSIDQNGRLTFDSGRSAHDDWMASCFDQPGIDPAGDQVIANKFGSLAGVAVVGWLGTDRGDPDQGLELLFKSSGVIRQKLIDAGPLAIRCFGGHWQAPLIQANDESDRRMRVWMP